MVMWETTTIGECAEIISGGTPSTTIPAYWDGDILWCTPTDITKTKNKYLSSTERTISSKGLKDSSAILLPVGTILLCSRATIGEMCIAAKPISTNQGFKNLVCGSDVDNNFMYYLLQTKIGAMLELAIGSTFLEISKKALASIEISLPPLPEQRRIAAALSDADALITALERLIAKKRAIKQGAMQELLTGKRRLPGFSGEWMERELNYYINDFIVPMRDKPQDLSGNIPWCRIEDFDGKFLCKSKSNQGVTLDTVNAMNLKIYPVNTLIVSCSAYLGRCAIIKKELVTNQTFIGLVPNSKVNVEYLFYVMCREEQRLNTLSSGTTISYLSREQFEEYSILMPPTVSEQTAIAEILSDMDAEIDKLTAKLNKLRGIKQGMMSELLTGRIRLVEQDVATNTENLNAGTGREN